MRFIGILIMKIEITKVAFSFFSYFVSFRGHLGPSLILDLAS